MKTYIDISIDTEDILGELSINDIIEFFGFEEICKEIDPAEYVKHHDSDDILSELELDDIKEHIKDMED